MPNGMPHMCRTSSTHASPPTSSSKSKQFRRSQRTTPKVAAPPSTAATPRPWATCTPSATLSKNSRKRCSAPGSEARRTTPRCHTRPASVGYVARRPGDYSDAIDNKKLKVHMLLMESLGGIAPGGVAYLGKLAGLADPTAHGSRDSTTYIHLLECPHFYVPPWHVPIRRDCICRCPHSSRRRPPPQDLYGGHLSWPAFDSYRPARGLVFVRFTLCVLCPCPCRFLFNSQFRVCWDRYQS